MATITRQTTWASLQTLTASALNGEFNNIVNAWNNHDAGTSRWTVVDATTIKKAGNTQLLIPQVVTATYQTQVSTASATYTDSGLTATITPFATTSKIAVIVSQSVGATNAQTTLRLLRGASQLIVDFQAIGNANASQIYAAASLIYMDSPSSTSALTYKTQVAKQSGAGTSYAQPTDSGLSGLSTIWLVELQ